MDTSVKNLRVLVTAGAQGIGLAITEAFADAGAQMHICDIDEDFLASARERFPGVSHSRTDVSDAGQVDAMFEQIGARWNRQLDVLVNNAAVQYPQENLEDISSLYVDFRLPERFLSRLKRGQPVEVQMDAFPGRAFKATVEAIDPLVDANGRSIGVRAVLPNTAGQAVQTAATGQTGQPPAGAQAKVQPTTPPVSRPVAPAAEAGPLRPGMFAKVTAVFAVRDNALTVPEEAIVPQGGRQFVIKVVPADTLAPEARAKLPPETVSVSQRAEVKLGIRRPGRVELLDGVAEGDTVVVAGQQRLQKDGAAVRVIDMARPAGPPAAAPAAAAASVPTSTTAPGAAPAPTPAAPPAATAAAR